MSLFKKSILTINILTILNPFVYYSGAVHAAGPSTPRDTDIFTTTLTSSAAAEPNILLILDNSDSMNIPEPWKEYPGAYDSHVEYLSNDISYIAGIGCPTSSMCGSTAYGLDGDLFTNAAKNLSPPADYTSGYLTKGYFEGATTTDRISFKQDLITYAKGIESVDGAAGGSNLNVLTGLSGTDRKSRFLIRNYQNFTESSPFRANMLYWTPFKNQATASAELTDSLNDFRLRSNALNKFPGYKMGNYYHTTKNTGLPNRGGITYDISYGVTQCRAYNSTLIPSTPHNPTIDPKNDGFVLGSQWKRWNGFRDPDRSKDNLYPNNPNSPYAGKGKSYNLALTPLSAGVMDSYYLPIALDPASVTNKAGWENVRSDAGGIHSYWEMYWFGGKMGGLNALRHFDYNGNFSNYYDIFGFNYINNVMLNEVYGIIDSVENAEYNLSLRSDHPYALTPPNGDKLGVIGYRSTASSGTSSAMCEIADASGTVYATDPRPLDTQDVYWDNYGSPMYYRVTTDPAGGSRNPICQVRSGYSGTCAWTPTDITEYRTGWTPYKFYVHSVSGRINLNAEGNTYWHSGTCYGGCRVGTGVNVSTYCPNGGGTPGVNDTPTAAYAIFNNSPANYSASRSINSTTYYNVINQSTDLTTTNNPRLCLLSNILNNTGTPQTSINATPIPCATHTGLNHGEQCNYKETCTGTYNQYTNTYGSVDFKEYHFCSADETSNRFLRPDANWGSRFNLSGNTINGSNTNSPTTVGSGFYGSANFNWADTTNNPKINVFSANYLNWKFGAKRNGNPVGRKTRIQIAKDTLTDFIQNSSNGMRIGLMIFNDMPTDPTTQIAKGSPGAHIVFAVNRMGTNNTADPNYGTSANTAALTNRTTLINKINQVQAKAATPLTESLYEAYLYFSGRAPHFGTAAAITTNLGALSSATTWGTVTGESCIGTDSRCTLPPDPSAISGGKYVSPMLNNPSTGSALSCQKNAIILITDGNPDRDSIVNSKIANMTDVTVTPISTLQPTTFTDITGNGHLADPLATPANSTPATPKDPNNGSAQWSWLDELAYFMGHADVSPGIQHFSTDTATNDSLAGPQNVSTYTIGFANPNIDTRLLKSAATNSNGLYFDASNASSLASALSSIAASMSSYTPMITSGTVPISALNRSQNDTSIYMSFFRPSSNVMWTGTMKKYNLELGDTNCGTGIIMCLGGQTNLNVSGTKNIEQTFIDPVTQSSVTRVNPNAVSYWGPNTLQDGGDPENGGTGYQLKQTLIGAPNTRKIYTWLPGQTNLLTNANNSVSLSNLTNLRSHSGANTSDMTKFVNFINGYDVTGSVIKPWPHFDIQHSRPVVVTYNPNSAPPSQYAFYLSNDGLLHAVDTNTGVEAWSFLLTRNLENSNIRSILNGINTTSTNNNDRLDNSDGSPVVYTDVTKTYLYVGGRRGTHTYYALDITNISQPKFLWYASRWKFCNTTICTSTGGIASKDYSRMGYTWSTPTIIKLKIPSLGIDINDPVLVFGGGYDTNQDSNSSGDTEGKVVYVVNGTTGDIIKQFHQVKNGGGTFNIPNSIPSEVTAVNADGDANNLADRLYVGDTGGNVYRFDVRDQNPSRWAGRLLAKLSTSGVTRKILFQPAVVKQNNPFRFDAIYVGTGNKENPTLSTSNDVIAMIIDKDTNSLPIPGGTVSYTSPLADLNTTGDFFEITNNTVTGANLSGYKGWVRYLEAGEKVINAPTVFYNKLRFGSYAPNAIANGACLPPGQGRQNEIHALNGELFNLNNTSSITNTSRYFANFVTRGYISGGQVLVIGGNIYHVVTADSRLMAQQISTMSKTSNIFWYTESEK